MNNLGKAGHLQGLGNPALADKVAWLLETHDLDGVLDPVDSEKLRRVAAELNRRIQIALYDGDADG